MPRHDAEHKVVVNGSCGSAWAWRNDVQKSAGVKRTAASSSC